jgi:hypothetical protein
MSGGFAVRFSVEVAFLVLLALAAGFADFETWQIALIMVVGWVLVTVIELLAWRSDRQLEEQLNARFASRAADAQPEPQHGWDREEILAPLPDEGSDEEEAFTSVMRPEEGA